MLQDQDHKLSPPIEDGSVERQCLSPMRDCPDDQHWDSAFSKPGSRPLDREFSTGPRPAEMPGLSPVLRQPEEQIYNPEPELLHCPGFGSLSEPVDQRGGSPDLLIRGSSTFPPPFGQRTNGEKITVPEYKMEVSHHQSLQLFLSSLVTVVLKF